MENEKTPKKRVRTTSVITLLICMIDIYIIINIPEDYTILAAAMFLTLVSSVLTINSWFKWKDLEGQNRNEQYTDIMNVQKSSYVIIQKKVQDLDEKLNFIGQKIMPLEKAGDVNQRKIASMLDSIVEDQKKIAKITISRSKENADALMNPNDKLLLQMEEFRDSISGMQGQLLSQQEEIHNEEAKKLDKSTDEIFKRITELRDLLVKEADEISENILTSQQSLEESYSSAIEAAAESKNMNSAKDSITEEKSSEEIHNTDQKEEQPIAEDVLNEEQMVSEETAFEEQNEQQAASEEAVVETPTGEEPVLKQPELNSQIEQPESVPESEQVSAVEEFAVPEPEQVSAVEEFAVPEPEQASVVEELPVPEPEQASVVEELPVPEPEQASVVEELPVPEPIVVPDQAIESPAADSSKSESDSGMSPEDIAALIAKTESENLPETTAKYEEEEKPPMPDMSDPNRPMSPEDIAALIANM